MGVFSFCARNEKQHNKATLALRRADNHRSLFAGICAFVHTKNGKRILKTSFATSKLTPCFLPFASAFARSHSNFSFIVLRDSRTFN